MRPLRALASTLLLSLATSSLSSSCSKNDDRSLDGTPGTTGGSGGTGGTGVVISVGASGSGGTVGVSGSGSGGTGTEAAAGSDGLVDDCSQVEGLGDCGGAKIEATPRTVNMLLVIDKSGSMTDPFGDQDKWTALKAALAASLGNVRTQMNFGLILFPYSAFNVIPVDDCGDYCCDLDAGAAAVTVPIAPGTTATMQIGGELDKTMPGGGTPTAKALAAAYDYFANGDGASLQGDNYVLLATDGGPNCNQDLTCDGDTCTTNLDNQCQSSSNCCKPADSRIMCLDSDAVLAALESLEAIHVPTFVVGLPGTQQYSSYLDQFAEAGGEPNPTGDSKYYAVSAAGGVQGLVDVFDTITTQLLRSCEIPLTAPPADSSRVNVAVDCNVVPHDGSDGSGWKFDQDIDPTEVILSGPVCNRLQANGAKRIDVVFGCKTVR